MVRIATLVPRVPRWEKMGIRAATVCGLRGTGEHGEHHNTYI